MGWSEAKPNTNDKELPEPDIRLYRRYLNFAVRQIIVYLRPSNSPLVFQDQFQIDNLTASFEIIRLWEQPTEQFLTSSGLFPFAVLANTTEASGTLQQVAQEIEKIEDITEQRNIAASTAILAGLKLNKGLVRKILRSDIMRESVIYQEIEQEGREEGSQQEAIAFALRLLKRRLGTVNAELETQVQSLSVEKLEALGEALLDLNSETEIRNWLENCHS